MSTAEQGRYIAHTPCAFGFLSQRRTLVYPFDVGCYILQVSSQTRWEHILKQLVGYVQLQ